MFNYEKPKSLDKKYMDGGTLQVMNEKQITSLELLHNLSRIIEEGQQLNSSSDSILNNIKTALGDYKKEDSRFKELERAKSFIGKWIYYEDDNTRMFKVISTSVQGNQIFLVGTSDSKRFTVDESYIQWYDLYPQRWCLSNPPKEDGRYIVKIIDDVIFLYDYINSQWYQENGVEAAVDEDSVYWDIGIKF